MESLFQLYYRKYKQYFYPITILMISVLVIFKVTWLQFDSIFATRAKIEAEKIEVADLNTSLNYLRTQDEQTIESNLNIINKALPSKKDLVNIYLAILEATSKSNTELNGFSAGFGSIYEVKVEGDVQQNQPKSPKETDSVKIETQVKVDSFTEFKEFTKTIQEVLPLADIVDMKYGESEGVYKVTFYYKDYDESKFKDITKVQPLESKYLDMLQKLENKIK